MAQQTSELWKTLWKKKGTYQEYAFDISGIWYGPDHEVDHSVDSGLYEEFSIGNAATAKLNVSLYAEEIQRAATIKRYVRLKNGAQVTEWLPKGVFFTNRRSEDDGYWEIEAYDAMRKAEVEWIPDNSLKFPVTMKKAVDEFARIMQVQIDPRTSLSTSYTIDYPVNGYTIRDELRFIAAAHCGNWIVTGEGKLYLVPLLSTPEETSCLVTEYGEAIILGGVGVYVG